MATIKKFEDIQAWQEARVLCREIFSLCQTTALGTDYTLRNQINSAAGSIMDNIAEGFGRGGNREFIQFLEIANGSANEVQSQLYRVLDRNYIDKSAFDVLYSSVEIIKSKILKFITYLKNSEMKGPKFYTDSSKK